MSKINVLQVVSTMNCGGAETMLMNIFRNIDREKFQFHFLYYTDETCYFDEEIKSLDGIIHRINNIKELGAIGLISKLKHLIKAQSIEAIHAHTSLSIGVVMYAAKKAGVPIRIAHSHTTVDPRKSTFKRNIYNTIMKSLIKKYSTHYLMCGDDAGRFLFGSNYLRNTKLLPNAIDLSQYTVAENNIQKTKKTLSLLNNTLIIGQVGSFKETKNHKFSLEIASKLKEKGINFKMLFAGEGELMEECIEYSRDLGVDNNILFLGNRSDISTLMNVFDVLLMPSLFEGLPVTLVEAQAAGLSCVVSNNISIESDFGVDLVVFLSLEESKEVWVKKIIESSKKERVDKNIINESIKNRGYAIEESVRLVSEIYYD
ncbi:glycosyltransferase family 1 protein [Mesobacillus harenae]|uniref:glycosyltransferase family 1 protein n=1 Tax=Mesobacillus harenae TaxID=2213203 RepID=UPI0015806F5C|nr:glycosyltransferase family 1 protein [Mesobacillus harenae]